MKGLVPLAMLLIGCGRPREHPKGHFQSKGLTRADIAQLPVAHACTEGSYDLRSLHVTFHDVTSNQKTPAMANIAQLPVAHAHTQRNS